MAKSRRYYYICDPNLPVARARGRGRTRIGRSHVFLIYGTGVEFVGTCDTAISLGHRGQKPESTSISVPLAMAKRLANERKHRVYVLHSENAFIQDEGEFVRSVIRALTPEEPAWAPPVGVRLGYPLKPYQEEMLDKFSERAKKTVISPI